MHGRARLSGFLMALAFAMSANAMSDDAAAAYGVPFVLCLGYGCAYTERVLLAPALLDAARNGLARAGSAAEEREALAQAVASLYGWLAVHTAIAGDRPGNLADPETPARLDCIDHSFNTTQMLTLIDAIAPLRHHDVRSPATRGLILAHRAARLEARYAARPMTPGSSRPICYECFGESPPAAADPVRQRQFVIDAWFVAPGALPVVLPLDEWMDGGGPDVE